MAKIIDGKAISAKERASISEAVTKLKAEGTVPGLAVIIVGEDPASTVYVRNKEKACKEVGFNSWVVRMPENTEESQLLEKIAELNVQDEVDGILVQLPLPRHIDEKKVIAAISPEKDVDAFHLENTGRIMVGDYKYLPCTPSGIMTMLEHENIEVSGKECVVVGRSNIVGKPMAMLLLNESGTVTVCHSRTKDLAEVTRRADILVVAVGKAEFITGDMIKPGAVVIDVGINRCDDGKLRGDVHFESAEKVASAITPVPGGVGPMTITTLLKNTLTAATRRAELKG